METTEISRIGEKAGRSATVRGWLYNRRSSGKIQFLIVRDGTGYLQAVVAKADVDPAVWEEAEKATQEASLAVTGTIRDEKRAPGGYEMSASKVEILGKSDGYPISPKEHGVDFLMSNRHLWMRSSRQHAVLRVRSELEQGIADFFYERGYVRIDSPILTPAACEGTSTLFETQYTEAEKAYLSQSGQLYLEPAAAAFGKVYCFGPTFRAEKSKTRRHLREFWMVEPEVAFLEIDGLMDLAEEFVCVLAARVLDRCKEDLKRLERDTSKLESIQRPFPRFNYRDAVEILRKKGFQVSFGDDFGGDEETALAADFDRPIMVTRYPVSIKAFYMQPDPHDSEVVLGLDMLAPEGYGEIIGGSQRIHDHDLLLSRIRQHNLPLEAFQWYLDLRKYGTFPHAGFGMGLERFVAWMCGVPHLRETIPYPRMLYRIYP
ncbi:MAG TPA: asparagine--tRNA ligase [Thermoanaerobaculia bacterium]|nr:asparagine--tRNA ligase [Thermoanaerobaculia bacterium]